MRDGLSGLVFENQNLKVLIFWVPRTLRGNKNCSTLPLLRITCDCVHQLYFVLNVFIPYQGHTVSDLINTSMYQEEVQIQAWW